MSTQKTCQRPLRADWPRPCMHGIAQLRLHTVAIMAPEGTNGEFWVSFSSYMYYYKAYTHQRRFDLFSRN